jgi:hypothetical protein
MKRIKIGGWGKEVECLRGHISEVFYTLPDYGDAPILYQCPVSGDLIAVSPDAEQYIGPSWDMKRKIEACPSCGEPLKFAPMYPESFRCPTCGIENHLVLPFTRYPLEDEKREIECWDPYH